MIWKSIIFQGRPTSPLLFRTSATPRNHPYPPLFWSSESFPTYSENVCLIQVKLYTINNICNIFCSPIFSLICCGWGEGLFPEWLSRMFWGLRSRWTTPLACRAFIAPAATKATEWAIKQTLLYRVLNENMKRGPVDALVDWLHCFFSLVTSFFWCCWVS